MTRTFGAMPDRCGQNGREGDQEDVLVVTVPLAIKRRGGRKLVVGPDGAPAPVQAPGAAELSQELRLLARAFRWRRMLEGGEYGSIAELAAAEGINPSYVGRVLRLTLFETPADQRGSTSHYSARC